jgi:hypothetical protein
MISNLEDNQSAPDSLFGISTFFVSAVFIQKAIGFTLYSTSAIPFINPIYLPDTFLQITQRNFNTFVCSSITIYLRKFV